MNLLTFDIEDGLNLNLRQNFGYSMNPTDRVVLNTNKILDLLGKYDVKGTFFILGEIAEFYPDLIRRIHDSGHEIGVHGYNHLLFTKNQPETIYSEISRAKDLLESITKSEVKGHRAPAFSITKDTPWAFNVIKKAGFQYDSSVVPATNMKYGIDGFQKGISVLNTEFGELIEVPISFIEYLGYNIPYLGGSYLVRSPNWMFNAWLSNPKFREQADYLMLYLHPYEFDTEYKNFPKEYRERVSPKNFKFYIQTLISRYNRSSLLPKIEKLIRETPNGENLKISDFLILEKTKRVKNE
jgi:polysaccharide deacetylase family protein (PEP-CTERM system associated)